MSASQGWAARLIPDPALPEEKVRQFLTSRITQPAILGELKISSAGERHPLNANLECDLELILSENFYTVVPRSDPVFAAVTDRLAELEQAEEQLNLVPKDFVASLAGQKPAAGLSFLKHTFVRTTTPAQTRARLTVKVGAQHRVFFFGAKGEEWQWSGPVLKVAAWQGKRLTEFNNPLPVDTPDFDQQLNAFLDTARKTLDEVDKISSLYIAKADEERAALFRALPVGAVLSVKTAKPEGQPLFLEVKTAEQKTGHIEFSVSSSFVSRVARAELLVGVHPDPASALRAMIDKRRQAETARTMPALAAPVVVEATTTKAIVEVSAKGALKSAQSVRLGLESGEPLVLLDRMANPISLERIPEQQLGSERARFQKEAAELLVATESGRVYHGIIDKAAYLFGVASVEGEARVFVLQPEVDDPAVAKMRATLLDVEREHPALKLVLGQQHLTGNLYGTVEITTKGNDLVLTGNFGVAQFQLVTDKSIRPSGRIVSTEMADFLNELTRNGAGLYMYPETSFIPVSAASAPEQSSGGAFGNALLSIATAGLGSLPTATLQFATGTPITRLKRNGSLYVLNRSSQLYALTVTKGKSNYTFIANRSNRGFAPRQQDFAPGLTTSKLDDGIFKISVAEVKMEGVFALVQSTGDTERTYYLVQIEP